MRYLSKNQSDSGSTNSGFTLVELVIVLAIIAMAAAATTVSIGRSREKAIIRDEARRVQGVLRQARQMSLMQRMPVTFMLDAEQGTYRLMKSERPEGRQHIIPGTLSVEADEITFFPKGNSTGGIVSLTDGAGRSYLIEVDNVTGLAKLRRV